MAWLREQWNRWGFWRRRHQLERELADEMALHRQLRAARLQREGLSEAEASRRARHGFGNATLLAEDSRAHWGWPWLDTVGQDLRYVARQIRRSPGFALATTAILALAIGVNAGFFTLYSNYVLRPLPIRGAERHVDLTARDRRGMPISRWTPDEIGQLRAATRAEMEGIYSASGLLQVLLLSPVQRPSMVTAVSANYFPLLGDGPALGRTFSEAEERQPVAVLSDAGRKRLFPGDTSPVGEQVRLRSTWFTVLGVMPPSFTGTEAAVPDLWVAAGMRAALRDGIGEHQRASGLLRPGISPARAEAALLASASRLPRPREERIERVDLAPHSTYFGGGTTEDAVVASAVFTAFLSVLLIACANLANLSMARTAARGHEIGVRFALGAGQGRIIRQLATENCVLGMLGAVAGLLIGGIGVTRFHPWLFSMATQSGAVVLPLTMDWRVFAYSAGLGLLASLAFGMFPALNAASLPRRQPRRLRGALLGGQVAASLVLLILAAVLVRNLQRLNTLDTGYQLDHSFDLQLEPPSPMALARLRTQPGVAGVTAVEQVPLYGRLGRHAGQAGTQRVTLAYNRVDEHYFETLALRLTSGRGFHRPEADANARVAVVSQTTARRLWPGTAAVGQTFSFAPSAPGESTPTGTYEVVGVVPDAINGLLLEGSEPSVVYLPGSAGQARMTSAVIRFRDPQPAMLAAVRAACAGMPGATGCDPRSLRGVAAMQQFPFKAAAAVSGVLGALALLLTAIGLHGVVSYSVQQRRREMGILLALGARPVQLIRRILGEPARWLVAGLATGLPCCLWLSWFAASSIFAALPVRVFDSSAYVAVAALLAAAAVAACVAPVRRALRADPMTALRQD